MSIDEFSVIDDDREDPVEGPVDEVDPADRDEEAWRWLGLTPRQRTNLNQLLRSKAWASLADLNPLATRAIELIDLTIESVFEAERAEILAERAGVEAAVEKYRRGGSLGDLIGELHAVDGSGCE